MAEQSRSFRKFMMDPKSSVMTYIADNIPQTYQQGHPGLGSSQNNFMAGQQDESQHPTKIQQNLGQSQSNLSQDSFGSTQTFHQPSTAGSQPSSSQPVQAQQTQTSQAPYGQAYLASNLDQPSYKPAINPILQSATSTFSNIANSTSSQ